ncbi:MAG: hypothetical protein HQL14_00170 [Candidatus Omnitrophica bacterium]|nr:hypothetical protein [Candidatus Omnitrophota bacterium]
MKNEMKDIAGFKSHPDVLWMFILFFICVAVRILPAVKVFGTQDVQAMVSAVSLLGQGNSPFSQSIVFNQSPFWVGAVYHLGQILYFFHIALPPHVLVKILPIISDGIITLLIYLIFFKEFKVGNKRSISAALFWALNPVSIIITSVHGNLVSIPAACLLFSLYLFIRFEETQWVAIYCSSFVLGIAIMSKIWPIFVLPLILQKIKTLKGQIIYFLLSVMPLILSLMPIYFQERNVLFRNFFQYQGIPGWWGFTGLSAIWHAKAIMILVHFYIIHGAGVLLAVVFLLYLFKTANSDLFKGSVLIYLAVLFLIPGFGPQYFIWVLPFLIITEDKMLFPFLFYVTILFLIEYSYRPFVAPYMGAFISAEPPTLTLGQLIKDHVITNLLRFPLWVFICGWFFKILCFSK